MFKFEEYRLRYFNFRLVLYIALLTGAGVIFIRSATMNSADDAVSKQIMGLGLGAVCMFAVALVDYHFWLKIWPVIYAVCIGMLLAVLVLENPGYSSGEARRWLSVGGFSLQPSEFSKIGLVLTLAAYFHRFRERISSLPVVAGGLILYGGIGFLIFKEPDLSTTLVTVFIFLVMIYVAGISYKWVFGVIGACIPVVGVLIYIIQQPDQTFIKGWQLGRITDWLYPEQASLDTTRQVRYSVQAIASGQLYGKGLFNTTLESVKNGNFLSQEDCDFIFAVVGEETGFWGSVIVIGLLALVVLECIWLAIRAKDLAGRLICVGIAGLLAFQSFVNIGVATRLLPNTGLPLPFISAGLSSLLSLMIGMGLVLNVGLQRRREKS